MILSSFLCLLLFVSTCEDSLELLKPNFAVMIQNVSSFDHLIYFIGCEILTNILSHRFKLFGPE